ncbi:hypothetical protein SUGI_1071520 [Cryptomeria japonica]|nr:hypothetical protein SUGI_1071520 [Cryptomeria japonica]
MEVGITELLNVNASQCMKHTFTKWDDDLMKSWLRLRMPKHFNKMDHQAQNRRLGVHWLCPPSGRVKLNFDGASHGNPGIYGIDCYIRDCSSSLVWGLSKKIFEGTNNEAELAAMDAGLDLCINKGLKQIEIEGDSLVCINVVKMRYINVWSLQG